MKLRFLVLILSGTMALQLQAFGPSDSGRTFNPKSVAMKREQEWKAQVDKFLEQGKPDEAMKVLSQALRVDAIHPYAMGMYAYLLLTFEEQATEAKEMSQNCLNLYPKNSQCLHTLAWSHYRNQEYARALRTFEEIQGDSTGNFDLHYHWAMAAWKAGKPSVATTQFGIARKLEPESVKLNISLGVFLESQKDYQRALRAYHQALSLVKEEEDLRSFLLGKINELLPLYKKLPPKRELQKARAKPPEQAHSRAEKRPAVAKSGSNPFLVPLDTNPKALEESDSLESLTQEEHYKLAKELCSAGIKNDCIAQLNTVINLEPSNSLALSANSDLTSARELQNQGSKQRIDSLLKLAEIFFRDGRFKLSLLVYRKILLKDLAHPLARKNLAYLYLNFNRPVTALSYLEPLLEEHPSYQEALILKGYALAKLRRFSDASKALKAASSIKSGREFSAEYTRDLLDQLRDYEKPIDSLKSP